MTQIELGRGKTARRAYGLDDVTVLPSRRTRDPEEVSIAWEIDAYRFALPVLATPTDSVVSPATAATLGGLGVLGVLNAEGLWTRHADAESLLEELAGLDEATACARMRELYAAPVRAELIEARIGAIRASGVTTAVALSPQGTVSHHEAVLSAGVDLLVIRGTLVSAEHVSNRREALNLKRFIAELDVPVIVGGAATYQAALHLMRTGAAGVLVGVGRGAARTTQEVLGLGVPLASALADVAAARRDYLDESGGRYVHVIADGAIRTAGELVKAIACGADAAMLGSPLARASDAPGRGWHWGVEAGHPTLPRGGRIPAAPPGVGERSGASATLETVLQGPATVSDGSMNFAGALRRALATCGYSSIKEFQRVEVAVTC
ncbi:MAG: GuaB3 family IMP dehydrogenase-related protein [Mycobacteriales bacterium]